MPQPVQCPALTTAASTHAAGTPASHAARKRKMLATAPCGATRTRTCRPARARGTEASIKHKASTPPVDSGVVAMDTTGGANSSAQHANLGARANTAPGRRRLDAHLVFTLQARERERFEERVGRLHSGLRALVMDDAWDVRVGFRGILSRGGGGGGVGVRGDATAGPAGRPSRVPFVHRTPHGVYVYFTLFCRVYHTSQPLISALVCLCCGA